MDNVGHHAGVEGGLSGSPILSDDGRAVAVVSTGGFRDPPLADDLPGWFLRELDLR